jgi:hypothetical protein
MINNKSTINEAGINNIRSAIEHRATWFYLLLDEVKKSGANMEKIGRDAIFRCGCFHGEKIMKHCKDPKNLKEFIKAFADENIQKVFEMEIIENTKNKLYLDFHYCPLVAAWEKLGVKEDDIKLLCDMAMDGDRGIISQFDKYSFRLESSIAYGEPVCKIRIDQK